jgi:uncharacterized membrane protein YidH (DUF202 family)
METDEPPKLDNGAGGNRATKTGKPERVGESGDEPINLILGEIQVLLAEKRTALSSLRTGIAIFALPLSVLSVLIATSRYYSFGKVMPLLVPLLLLNFGLVVLGSWLIYRSIHRIHHFERRIRELSQKYRSIAEFIE